MRRSLFIWVFFLICLAVGLAAMGWMSVTVMRLDRRQAEFQRQAQVEEAVRLALWRMDSALAPLLAFENARPYFTYSAFFPAARAYPEMFAEYRLGEVLVPSPLLRPTSPLIFVHFQMECDGSTITSPEVPSPALADLRNLAIRRNYVTADQLTAAATRIDELKKVLKREPLLAALPDQRNSTPWASPTTNPAGVPQALTMNSGSLQFNGANNVTANANPNSVNYSVGNNDNNFNNAFTLNNGSVPNGAQTNTSLTGQGINVDTQQAVQQPQQNITTANNAAPQIQMDQQYAQNKNQRQAGAYMSPAEQQELRSYNEQETRRQDTKMQTASIAMLANRDLSAANVNEGVMKPIWVGSNLILARRVAVNGKEYIQGAWFDWPATKQWLLANVDDLMDGADLQPIADDGITEPHLLASIPARLIPGLVAPAGQNGSGNSASRIILPVAWASLILASLAVAILLRGVMALSNRRGAFVSAVTHELRTPLTTLRMYTEMLAGGMVSDATKQRTYLGTLKSEADRLGHLVENVLSYSRLERRRTAARLQATTIQALLDRVVPRLSERAEQARMSIAVSATPDILQRSLNVDILSVEQILFNLIDNACKYAAPEASDRRIHLDWSIERSTAILRVHDHGPGMNEHNKRRLFRPFHKSVQEAAATAPGLGLGLALSKRLARNMGARLELCPGHQEGACLTLSLPLASS